MGAQKRKQSPKKWWPPTEMMPFLLVATKKTQTYGTVHAFRSTVQNCLRGRDVLKVGLISKFQTRGLETWMASIPRTSVSFL